MKKILIACALLGFTGAANAQNVAMNSGAHPDKNYSKRDAITAPAENEFAHVSISYHKGRVVFADLPQLDKPLWVVITDKDGEVVKQTKISPADTVVDVSKLDRGTYFIKLMYDDESKKAFVLNI